MINTRDQKYLSEAWNVIAARCPFVNMSGECNHPVMFCNKLSKKADHDNARLMKADVKLSCCTVAQDPFLRMPIKLNPPQPTMTFVVKDEFCNSNDMLCSSVATLMPSFMSLQMQIRIIGCLNASKP